MYKNWFWFIKIFCYLFLLLLINRMNEYYDFLIYVFLFFMMSANYKNSIMFGCSIIFALACATSFALGVPLLLLKIIVSIILIISFWLSFSFKDKQTVLETLFYSRKRSSKLIKKIYYNKIYNHNKKLIDNKQKLKKEIKIKTNLTMKDIFIKSKLRYYGFYKKRTIYIKRFLSSEDYIIILLVFLVAILLFI